MRHCKKCGASEKEVMLQTINRYSRVSVIDFLQGVEELWCINCIYNSKKHPIIYGIAGEMTGHQKEDFNTLVGVEYTNEFGWKIFVSNDKQLLRPWDERYVTGIDPYRKDDLWEQREMIPERQALKGIMDLMNEHNAKVKADVEYGKAMTERSKEDIEQESINVGKIMGWKIENNI